MPNGVEYLGTAWNMDIMSYPEWYTHPTTGVLTPMVPVKSVIMGSTRARTARHYGAIQDLRCNASVKYFPYSWITDDPARRFIKLQSAGCPTLNQPDAFVCRQCIA